MPDERPSVLMVAGEASGDLHASNLVRAIKRIEPSARFHGVGGRKLEAAGVGLIDNRIGAKASEIRTDGMMNKTNPPGSAVSISACALTMPTICTIM